MLGAKAVERGAGGLLLRRLLGVALAGGDRTVVEPALDAEAAAVARPLLRDDAVPGQRPAARLQQLLQRALRVLELGVAALEVGGEVARTNARAASKPPSR